MVSLTDGPLLVIIDDLDRMRSVVSPNETDAPLVIDPDGVLSGSIPLQRFQAIAWRYPQRQQADGCVKHQELATRDALDIRR